ncbi:hypothetical protein HMPREF9123_0479 [Neisseria bacilliformis ATCC BAA-1200]|uniref:Uncharacterized protein n=1 Tax=Neisseria bacilliformis ATCC BAA-1200 TaxID=888742 RepID=F2B9S5_9NEIS|nr:hypothetical protein HMPREF9123_0479 [Neisseria bacilliformis ATCC BAA-1200]
MMGFAISAKIKKSRYCFIVIFYVFTPHAPLVFCHFSVSRCR